MPLSLGDIVSFSFDENSRMSNPKIFRVRYRREIEGDGGREGGSTGKERRGKERKREERKGEERWETGAVNLLY